MLTCCSWGLVSGRQPNLELDQSDSGRPTANERKVKAWQAEVRALDGVSGPQTCGPAPHPMAPVALCATYQSDLDHWVARWG